MEILTRQKTKKEGSLRIKIQHHPESGSGAAILHSPWAMLLTAVLLGFISIAVYHSDWNPSGNKFSIEDTFDSFGWESVSIAGSIAQGKGFSSPFGVPSGPTAWLPPVYPYLLAGVFRVFGLYSEASAIVIEGINVIFLALTSVVLFRIAKRLFDQQVAIWAGWTWSVLPFLLCLTYNPYFAPPYFDSIFIVWESALSTLVLSALLLISLEVLNSNRPGRWAAFGLTWGVAALANPVLLSLLPFSLGRACFRLRREGRSFWSPAGITLLVLGLTVTPWMMRNYRVFSQYVFIRSNLGAELHYGNLPVSEGIQLVHPTVDKSELAKYVQLGETRYMQNAWAEFLDFVHHNPGRFVTLTVRRLVFYWAGEPVSTSKLGKFSEFRNAPYLVTSVLGIWGLMVARRRRRNGIGLVLALVLVFPAVYYLSSALVRYRAPLEPEMVMLSIFLIRDTLRSKGPSTVTALAHFPGRLNCTQQQEN
jgi:Dolichyl-phosphate-mannose-protein mannosyltransferase